ncbi:MAG: DUF1802 family protein [Richelia sp. RM2_1_2]|nr:DUF1802 family protein [Richelia sp. SM1_7_0]NJO26179.1 DUF1802 family protein [Richelia sp. SL_2_1]NJO58124.1 DUF1802 family protein [Richelia sp. RM2_1_2]
MNLLLPISTALCLPTSDIAALIQGRIIAAIPKMFIRPGQKFALYPVDLFAIEEKVSIQAWAKCELTQILDESLSLERLSRLTIWAQDALDKILHQQQHIFLCYLRLYKLSQPYEISVKIESNKLGKFVGLPNYLTVSDANPVLPDNIFATRKRQLEKLEPPQHPELEELLDVLSPLAINNPAAKQLEKNINIFLGWSNQQTVNNIDSELAWIKKIAEVGNSSDGNEFERLVRKSFIKLGFSCSNTNPKANLDPEKLGGAGGVDFYCESPYPVVGECKATKSEKVPSGTPGQLIKLGHAHLPQIYDFCVKIILAAGELTKDAILTAQNNQMNVITPEILEKLVKLQSNYQGCINLFELKQCLQQEPFGLADDKIIGYISKIENNIKLRSHLIEIVKKHQENTGDKYIEVATLYGAYGYSKPPQSLNRQEMHEILIELSSPLTGYLGRIKGTDWNSDKFYFLRDLPIE